VYELVNNELEPPQYWTAVKNRFACLAKPLVIDTVVVILIFGNGIPASLPVMSAQFVTSVWSPSRRAELRRSVEDGLMRHPQDPKKSLLDMAILEGPSSG